MYLLLIWEISTGFCEYLKNIFLTVGTSRLKRLKRVPWLAGRSGSLLHSPICSAHGTWDSLSIRSVSQRCASHNVVCKLKVWNRIREVMGLKIFGIYIGLHVYHMSSSLHNRNNVRRFEPSQVQLEQPLRSRIEQLNCWRLAVGCKPPGANPLSDPGVGPCKLCARYVINT